MHRRTSSRRTVVAIVAGIAGIVGAAVIAVMPLAAGAPPAARTFASPEDAVLALTDAVKAGNLDQVMAIFGPGSQELVASSDPATGRQNREVFSAAVAEGWSLTSQGANRRTLVIGNEAWPFPVPLVKSGTRWRFDTASGREEVVARRIGRNELAVIATVRTYVDAQRSYARDGHDGKRAGLYATTFTSERGRQNGLYWAEAHGQKPSPLGDLVAQASAEGRPLTGDAPSPSPFHGYYFRILTAQGGHVPGGAKSYLVDGELSDGFALVAWPAQYDATGVMTFVINQSGIVRQKDLGPETETVVRGMTRYDPDASWSEVR